MKKILLFALAILLYSACKNNSDSDSTTDQQQQTPVATVNNGSGTSITPRAPEESPLVPVLTRDYWVFEFYVDPDNKANNVLNRGRWYNLQPDGTFTNGHWEEEIGSGSWILMKDGAGKNILRLDNVVDVEDAEFEVQFNQEADAASWIGTDTYGQGSIMIKAISLMTMPTKAQFGLGE